MSKLFEALCRARQLERDARKRGRVRLRERAQKAARAASEQTRAAATWQQRADIMG